MQKLPKCNLILWTICLMTMILCAGCIQQKPLEKLGLITTSGYDLAGKNKIKGTAVVQKFDPMTRAATKVITSYAKTTKGLRQQENLQSNQKLVSGQLRSVTYSRELAKKGIIQLVDTLNRDAAIGNMVYLTIADQTASEIMQIENRNKGNLNLGTYMYNLIKQNVEGEQVISPTLHEFNHNYYDIGRDPVLPILKVKGKDVIISGVGLFQEDRLVDELKQGDLFYLKILVDKYKAGTKEMGFKPEQLEKLILKNENYTRKPIFSKIYVTVDNIRSKTKIKLVNKKKLHFRVDVKLDSRVLEMTQALDLGKPASVKFLQKKFDQQMKKKVEELLLRFKELGIDPVGLGNEYEAHLRGKTITKEEWDRVYKDVTFDVHVKNTIERTGVID
ncbi:Ger(x)C family spore germination protein [Neobacillus sp. MER 74]|uniref:Ger(x)C family spore germination protein n=1 Tax=Neobacillus sp. MER 74 TaxID=2939566 RepID=UPI00203EFE2F|nr:Ger(x)C family spore germination protein [Neobacillus sp. MER 74]MCM3114518.1 Ger(x)C family spore germination protein [Neobacillus sp. MER 74]